MDKDDVARLEAHLVYLRERMERLEEGLRPEPTCLSYPDAAKRLGVGLTKFKEMVRRREISTTLVGRVPMVSLAEIQRVATPQDERPAVQRRQRAAEWQPIPKKRRGR